MYEYVNVPVMTVHTGNFEILTLFHGLIRVKMCANIRINSQKYQHKQFVHHTEITEQS